MKLYHACILLIIACGTGTGFAAGTNSALAAMTPTKPSVRSINLTGIPTQTEQKKLPADTSDAKAGAVTLTATPTNALAVAVKPIPIVRTEPRYELIRMTTEALAERQAIIGWEIKRKKRSK